MPGITSDSLQKVGISNETQIPASFDSVTPANQSMTINNNTQGSLYGINPITQGLVANGLPGEVVGKQTINGDLIVTGTINAGALVVGNQLFTMTMVFSTSAYNVLSWTAGSIRFQSGGVVSIDSGTTGALAGSSTRYIYYDVDTGSTLQVTTDQTVIVGDKRALVAIMLPQASTARGCIFTTMRSNGTTISGDSVTTGKIQSSDGKTYFDLTNNKIVMNDGTNDRVLIGYVP